MAKKIVKRFLTNYNLKKCPECGHRDYDPLRIYIFIVELMIGTLLFFEIWKLIV